MLRSCDHYIKKPLITIIISTPIDFQNLKNVNHLVNYASYFNNHPPLWSSIIPTKVSRH